MVDASLLILNVILSLSVYHNVAHGELGAVPPMAAALGVANLARLILGGLNYFTGLFE